MTKRITSQETIKRRTIQDMKELGVHKPQFNRLIDIYSGLVHQYLNVVAEFEESGYEYETETAAGNPKKSGIVSAMESLRKDILQYSDRLCLNPKSIGATITNNKKKSVLASVLSELDK